MVARTHREANSPATGPYEARDYPHYALVLTESGRAFYEDDRLGLVEVHPGDLIVVLPGRLHHYGAQKGHAWTQLYVVFDGPVFDAWRSAGLLEADGPIWRLGQPGVWARRMQRVIDGGVSRHRALTDQPQLERLAEVCRVQELLRQAIEARERPTRPGLDAAWAEYAKQLLEADPERGPGLPLEPVARRLRMSYSAFRRRFRAATSISPGRYRAERLIDRACELMHERRLADHVIAAELGFTDPAHFSRRFRQVVGLTPREYRRRFA
jgi:AraC-like DNA-binding protein